MQHDSIELLGLVAGLVGACAYAPQAVKIWREKSARDVSALTYTMVLAGNLLWIGYGVLRAAPSIVIPVAAAIATFVLTLKVTTRTKASA